MTAMKFLLFGSLNSETAAMNKMATTIGAIKSMKSMPGLI
jgi:hypothetical protein